MKSLKSLIILLPEMERILGMMYGMLFLGKTWSQIMPQGNVETKQYNQRANELEKEAELQANEFFMTNKEDRDDGE